jgi:hypothetical protein
MFPDFDDLDVTDQHPDENVEETEGETTSSKAQYEYRVEVINRVVHENMPQAFAAKQLGVTVSRSSAWLRRTELKAQQAYVTSLQANLPITVASVQ